VMARSIRDPRIKSKLEISRFTHPPVSREDYCS
jgi:hypothetical protein